MKKNSITPSQSTLKNQYKIRRCSEGLTLLIMMKDSFKIVQENVAKTEITYKVNFRILCNTSKFNKSVWVIIIVFFSLRMLWLPRFNSFQKCVVYWSTLLNSRQTKLASLYIFFYKIKKNRPVSEPAKKVFLSETISRDIKIF